MFRIETPTKATAVIRISVVIPTFKESDRIAETIAMARAAGGDEIVVVDGHSPDGTADAARAAKADKVLETAAGRGSQLALGCKHVSGDVVLMLHADASVEPGALEGLRRDAEAFFGGKPNDASEHPYWGCLTQRIDSDRSTLKVIELGNRWRARCLRLPMGDQGIFVSRQTLDRIGGIDDVPLLEDVRLGRRLRRLAAPRILPISITISDRRWRRDGVIRRTLGNWKILAAHRCGVSEERLARWYAGSK